MWCNQVLKAEWRRQDQPPSSSSASNTLNTLNNININNNSQQQKKRRVKQIFLLSTLTFLAMLVFDGLLQFTDLSSKVEISVIEAKTSVKEGFDEVKENVEELERRLIDTTGGVGDEGDGGGRRYSGTFMFCGVCQSVSLHVVTSLFFVWPS